MSIFTFLMIVSLAGWAVTDNAGFCLIACICAVCDLFNDDYRLR